MIRFDLVPDYMIGKTLISSLDKASHLSSTSFYPIQCNIDTSKSRWSGLDLDHQVGSLVSQQCRFHNTQHN